MQNEEFGDYVLQELIGRGGMGEVFRAYDTRRRRIVALKRLPAALSRDEAFQRRFRTESEVAARLNEPHVLPVHNYGEVDGRLFIDMRYVEGPDLGSLLARKGALPPERAVMVVGQVGRALDAAHRDGLVHRDVKPSNVLISVDDERENPEFAYLTDFGVAQIGGADTSLSSTNATAGTVDYMAPERFSSRRVDHRVDVYSLGCLLHETLTGDKPYAVTSMPEAMHAHIYQDPPRPSESRPDVPAGLDDVVAKAMAKDPDDRYPSCAMLAADARACLTPDAGAAVAAETEVPGSVATFVPDAPREHEMETVVAPAAAPQGPIAPDAATEATPSRRPGRRVAGLVAAVVALVAVAAVLLAVLPGGAAPQAEEQAPAAPAPTTPATAAPESAAAPAAAPAVQDAVFTGRSSDNEITVALAVRNGRVAAYLCDGERIESWLEGTTAGNEVRLESPRGAVVQADLDPENAFGTMTVAGRTLPFSAQVAPPPAGLYEARAGSTRIGWIVLPDGDQVGLASVGATVSPAPALDVTSMSTTVNGAPVAAAPVAADGGGWG